MRAIKKSNGKEYEILRSYVCPDPGPLKYNPAWDENSRGTWERWHADAAARAGQIWVDYQCINPRTNKPWQSMKHAPQADFRTNNEFQALAQEAKKLA